MPATASLQHASEEAPFRARCERQRPGDQHAACDAGQHDLQNVKVLCVVRLSDQAFPFPARVLAHHLARGSQLGEHDPDVLGRGRQAAAALVQHVRDKRAQLLGHVGALFASIGMPWSASDFTSA